MLLFPVSPSVLLKPHFVIPGTKWMLRIVATLLWLIYLFSHFIRVLMFSEPAYKIVESGERGKIVVATRDILPGELVFHENEPVLHVSNEFISQQQDIGGVMALGVAVMKKFAVDLSHDQKEKILSLFGPTDTLYASFMRPMILQMVKNGHLPIMNTDSYWKVFQVFNFNAFELNARGHGVFDEFTRLSHSCAPNCSFSFRGKAVYCYARTFIKNGEELTITYRGKWDLEPTHERRYTNLQAKEFTCHCPRCDAIGDYTRQFNCADTACKGVMMVCHPINNIPILLTDLQYTGVEYVEPHLLPCTVCHRAASTDYQTEMLKLEARMYEARPRLVQVFADFSRKSTYAKTASELMELLHVPLPPRHAAALPFLRTKMNLSATLLFSGEDTRPSQLQEAKQAALDYITALFHILPVPSDSLSEELKNVVALCCRKDTVPILTPETERLVCGEALRMRLLLCGRDWRERPWMR